LKQTPIHLTNMRSFCIIDAQCI